MKAKQFYFLLLGMLMLSVAGIVGSFIWGKNQLKSNAISVSEQLAERDAQRDNIILLQQAESQIKDIDEVNELLDRLLPTQKNQETLILDIIYTATAESGIALSNISTFSFGGSGDPDALSGTAPNKEVSGVLEYPFSLNLQNINYDVLLKFLKEIETNGRIIQVDNVQINPSKKDPGLLTSVSLSLKAYLKP
jgi:Tfp pilus assembly protein PilO